jgi:hypothetical protein
MNDEIKKKISESLKGRKKWPLSAEIKEKISAVKKGKKSGAKGKHWKLSDETKLRMSIAKKKNPPWFGKKLSKSHIANVIKGLKRNNKDKVHKCSELHLLRKSSSWKHWRNSVFERDNWKCKSCNINCKELHPHHILNFYNNIENRFNVDNGITLCKKCHRDFHKKYGTSKNDRKQLNEFINNITLTKN